MKQIIIKASSFIVVFFLSLYIIGMLRNMSNVDTTIEMSAATLPVMNLQVEGHDVNTLFGYTKPMEGKYLRETLTPIKSDKKVSFRIQLMGTQVDEIAYEVRSVDFERLVEKNRVYNYVHGDDDLTGDISLKDLIDPKQEYALVFILKCKDREVKYYTRITEDDDIPAADMISFVSDFHEKTFDKAAAASLATYLESNEEGDNSTYQKVNIHSSFYQVTWGDLNIENVSEAQIQICDMDTTLSTMRLDYYVDIAGANPERYLVKELFRIRHTPERIYLLDYDRTMNQIFMPYKNTFVNDKIMLGIVDQEEIDLYENSDGSAVVFTQCNSLYEYRNSENTLVSVFSFYNENNMDERTLNDRHDIKVLDVDELGNIFFIVYGYMDRGEHEGEAGVSVYYYDRVKNYIQEKVFIAYDKSVDMLRDEVETLSYINRDHNLYVYLNDAIYCVNLDDHSKKIVEECLGTDRLVTSRSNKVAAWVNEEGNKITVEDLNSAKQRFITVDEGQSIHPVGFLRDNVIYGISNKDEVVRDNSGIVTIPMHTINIEDKNGTVLKTYSQENIYVTATRVSESALIMERVRKNPSAGTYYNIENDQIMDSRQEDKKKNDLTQVITQNRETVTEIAIISTITGPVKVQNPMQIAPEGSQNFAVDNEEVKGRYLVYGMGDFYASYASAAEAVKAADSINGYVVNADSRYVWQKGNRQTRCENTDLSMPEEESQIPSLPRCMATLLKGRMTPKEIQIYLDSGETGLSILRKNSSGEVLNLSGCSLSCVLYYVSEGIPVLAAVENGEYVLIVGYDEKNTIILDPATSGRYRKGMNDSAEWFMSGGNEFIVMYGE
ncbi:MAG: hypothetical protein IKR56_00375 [Lachnospiraceae bacterium]|nr:hypothetical protein [Lachnospiraceae bacterium]